MPAAWAHSLFWARDTAGPDAALGRSASGGYVPWQTTVIATGMGLALICLPSLAPMR